MNDWISVKEKTPANDKDVLVLLTCASYPKQKKIFSGFYTRNWCVWLPDLKFKKGYGGRDFEASIWEILPDDSNKVTHWMPLPDKLRTEG